MKKKAQLQIPGAVVDIYAVIAFVLVMLIFILLFQIRGCTTRDRVSAEIQAKTIDIDSNLILLNYLRTPVIVDEKNIDIADLIILTLYNGSYETKLKEESERTLTPIYEEPYFWSIIVYDKEDDEILELWQEQYTWTVEYDEILKTKLKIPYPKVNGTYTIELTKWED